MTTEQQNLIDWLAKLQDADYAKQNLAHIATSLQISYEELIQHVAEIRGKADIITDWRKKFHTGFATRARRRKAVHRWNSAGRLDRH